MHVMVTVARTAPRVSWTQLGLTATGVNVILVLQGTNVKVSSKIIQWTNVKISSKIIQGTNVKVSCRTMVRYGTMEYKCESKKWKYRIQM